MGNEARIRPLAAADVARVVALDAASDGSAHWPATAYFQASDVPSVFGWVAEEQSAGSPMGFIAVRCVADEMEILNFAVARDFRRQGIAHSLLQHALGHARPAGVNRVYLEVRASNQAAISFYKAQGFAEAGRRKGYYANPPDDALIFSHDVISTAPPK